MVLLTLSACAGPLQYAAIDASAHRPYGYRESRTADGRYSLLVVVPAASHPDLAREFWERRARELCGHPDYRRNIFRADRPTVNYDYYGGRPGDFMLEGYLDCTVHAAAN